jgi:hypothetical protein
MTISVTHTTEVQGHGIQVQVNADAGETIAGVRTEYDSFPIGDDTLGPNQVQYSRAFSQVGFFSPGITHVVTVAARKVGGVQQTATHSWTD